MGKWILLAVIGIAAAVGVVVILVRGPQTPVKLREQADAVLKRISRGDVDALYDSAAPGFKERVSLDKFEAIARAMNHSLGRFRGVIATEQTEVSSGASGRAGRFVGLFEFARGNAHGNVSFRRIGGRWRLLGMEIDIPKSAQAKARTVTFAPAPHNAPPEVIGAVKKIISEMRDGDADAIYRDASSSFRGRRDEAAFREFLASRERAMGKLTGTLDIVSSEESADKTRADVEVALAFDRARTRGSFDLVKVGGDWKLFRLKVVVPSRRLPERKPSG